MKQSGTCSFYRGQREKEKPLPKSIDEMPKLEDNKKKVKCSCLSASNHEH